MVKKRILLKLTGEIFIGQENRSLHAGVINNIIDQIKQLRSTHQFGLVIGGGNFFRGDLYSERIGINRNTGHQIGMLATMMNGLIVYDLLTQHGIPASLLCAIQGTEFGKPISPQTIHDGLDNDQVIIFTAGTGNPYFTTDTNAILRALQMSADEIWKGTNVDGIYTADPRHDPHAQLLKTIPLEQAIEKKLSLMDATAYALAQTYHQQIRIFNIFTPNALLSAAHNTDFGSLIT